MSGEGQLAGSGRREPGVCPALLPQAGGARPAGSCCILEKFLNYLLAGDQRPPRSPSPGSEASPPPLSSPHGPPNLLQWPVPVVGDHPCSPQPHLWKRQPRARGVGAPPLRPLTFFLPGLTCHLLRSGLFFLSSGNPNPIWPKPTGGLSSFFTFIRVVAGEDGLVDPTPSSSASQTGRPLWINVHTLRQHQKHNLSKIY